MGSQSRKRVFVIGVRQDLNIEGLYDLKPNWSHSDAIQQALKRLRHKVLWKLPTLPASNIKLSDMIEFKAACFDHNQAQEIIRFNSRSTLGETPKSS